MSRAPRHRSLGEDSSKSTTVRSDLGLCVRFEHGCHRGVCAVIWATWEVLRCVTRRTLVQRGPARCRACLTCHRWTSPSPPPRPGCPPRRGAGGAEVRRTHGPGKGPGSGRGPNRTCASPPATCRPTTTGTGPRPELGRPVRLPAWLNRAVSAALRGLFHPVFAQIRRAWTARTMRLRRLVDSAPFVADARIRVGRRHLGRRGRPG